MAVLRAFHRLRFQTRKEAEVERFRGLMLMMKAKKAVSALAVISRRNYTAVLRKALKRLRPPANPPLPKPRLATSPESDKRLTTALNENTDLRQKVAKLKAKAKPQVDRSIQDLIEENQKLRDKVQVTEQSVGLFIREMASLLDRHEPPPLSDEDLVPRPPSKVKKTLRPKPRTRVTNYSPERVEESKASKKQAEKRRLQFD